MCVRRGSAFVSSSCSDRKQHNHPIRRQDYCLFLHFESVESKYGFTHHNGTSSTHTTVRSTEEL